MRKFLTFFFATILAYAVGFDVGWAADQTIELTATNLGIATSYGSSSKTVGGYTFNWDQAMTNANKEYIQINKKTGRNAYFWNSTAIPGLKSVKIDYITSHADLSFGTGTSVKSTTHTETLAKASAAGSYTFNVTSGDTYFFLEATSTGASYYTKITVTYDDGQGGGTTYDLTDGSTVAQGTVSFSVGGSTVTKAAKDAIVSLTATPARGYAFSSWSAYKTGDPSTTVNVNNDQFTMPEYAVTVVANFTALTAYNLAGASSNGSVAFTVGGSTVTTAYAGETVTATATADSGYEFSSWTQPSGVTNWSATDNVATFTMPAADVSVSATFTQQTSTVMTYQPSSGTAGTLNNAPSATPAVSYTSSGFNGYTAGQGAQSTSSKAGSITFTNLPSNYKVTKIEVEYCTNTSKGDGTIFATLNGSAIGSTFTVTAPSTGGTTVKSTTLYDNATGTAFSGDLVIGTTCTTNSVYIYRVLVTYEPIAQKNYDVTVTQAIGGTITASPVGEKVVDSGDKITVTATPDTGYELDRWTITGANETAPDANNQITATGNVTITATFTPISYTLSRTSNDLKMGDVKITDASGTELSTQPTSAAYGSTVYFKLFTKPGYVAATNPVTVTPSSLTVSGPDANNVYSFTMPAEEVSISAEFVAYHGTLKLAGHFNGQSNWREAASDCPSFTYNSSNDAYTITAYFTGIDDSGNNDFFFLLYDGEAKHPKADNGNYFIGYLDGTAMPFELSGGNNNNFGVAPGVYDIEINGALTSMKFTKRNYTMTFSPAAGDVNQGTEVTASCGLAADIAAIQAADANAAGTVTMTGSPVTLSTVGNNQTVNATASIGNISVTGSATYNVQRENTSNTYTLVTDASDLVATKKYIIVADDEDHGLYGLAVSSGDVQGVAQDVTVSGTKATIVSSTTPLTLEGTTGAWKFNTGSGYLYLSSYANNLKNGNPSTASNAETKISFNSNNTAVIVFNDYPQRSSSETAARYIQFNYNQNNPRFACYYSNQTPVKLYKQEDLKDFAINYATVANGSATGPDGANAEETVTVTVTAGTGYACTGIEVTTTDNNYQSLTATGSGNSYSFTVPANLAANSTITVTPLFAEAISITYVNKYIDANGDEQTGDTGGTVTGPASAVDDSAVYVTYTPANGYKLKSLEYAWASGHSEVSAINSNPFFLMPGTPTTVTAVFEKKPYNITVVSANGTVTGLPATAVSGTPLSFTITPVAGYTVTDVTASWQENEESGSITVTESNNTYSFNMPAHDVTVRVGYFSGDEYVLLTDIADINVNDNYLIVAAEAEADYTASGTKVKVLAGVSGGIGDYTETTLGSNGLLSSNSAMTPVTFSEGSTTGTYKIYIAGNGYITVTDKKLNVTSNVSDAADLSLELAGNAMKITSGNEMLRYNTSSPRFCFYNSNTGQIVRIYKLANTTQVKKPTITGAASEYIGLYNIIGTDVVTLHCATEGSTIQYKIGNAEEWTTYSEPFSLPMTALGQTVSVTARATDPNGVLEASGEVTATFTCIKPTWHTKPCGDNWDCTNTTFNNPVFIYPNGSLANRNAYGKANIRFFYTTDGTTPTMQSTEVPTPSSGDKFIFADGDMTLSIIPVINDVAGDPVSGQLTFVPAAPVIDLTSGPYDGDQTTRLSTLTKTNLKGTSWTTKIYYALSGNQMATTPQAFAFNDQTGEVTSEGWEEYNSATAPYINILLANGDAQTLQAVTVANFFGAPFDGTYSDASRTLNGTWKASAVSTANYTLTAANLDVVFSPAGGTYLYEKDVTLTPQNAIGNVTLRYSTTGTADANSPVYTGPIHVKAGTTTISVYAVDSRTGDGGTFSKAQTYNIGVQEPLYSPYPGEYSVTENDVTTYLYGNYYVAKDNATISVEIFDVSPDAEIHYTFTKTETNDATYDGSQPYPVPDKPTKASTKYDGTPINLEVGYTYVFSAIAYVGNQASTVRTRTFTVRDNTATGSFWYSIKEMNEETQNGSNGTTAVTKTLANPVEVVYMSTFQNDGVTPEFAFVRDNSGYGYIYFGKNATGKQSWKKYQPGDWIKGMTIKGKAKTWSASYINELDLQAESDNTAWNAGLLDTRALVPEYTTCRAIRQGWTADENFSGTDYESYVDKDKHLFGHYIHLRRNTLQNVTKDNNGKHQGTIVGELGTPLFYYDGLYLYSGHNGSPSYDQTHFNSIQNRGGTFDVYGIAYFYGPNAAKQSAFYQPYEVFPIDFAYIFPPIFHLEGDNLASDMTNHEPERTLYQPTTLTLSCETRGAQIWYKTSDMEAFQIYEGETINVDKSMTISTYSTHSTDKFDELESVTRTLTINMGQVPQPVISPESKMAPVVNGVVDDGDKVTATIAFESGADVPAGTEIYFTVDGSDPADESNDGRILYTGSNEQLQSIAATTTVRAIATADGFYSIEAEPRTYTFVKSNGIIYTLVESEADLTDDAVYVVVNREAATSMQRVQKDNNRDAVPVLFVTDDNKPAGHSFAGVEKEVFGNEDLAVFTLKKQGEYFNMHTANGTNNASIGFLYGNVSGATNQLLTDRTDDPSGRLDLQWTIEIGSDAAATMFTMKDGAPRYLRYNKSTTYNLFNTYASTATGKPVFLYKKAALPLATIEKSGKRGEEYTVADEMLVVHVQDNLIWAKDENMSIVRREKPEGQIDYMREVARSGAVGGTVVMNQSHEWDQSNWVLIEMPDKDQNYNAYKNYKGQVIKATTFTGLYDDDVNYRLISSTETLDVRDTHVDVDAIRNVYSTANFLDANLTDEGVTSNYTADTYFFVNPKIQEVAMITYAVYAGNNVFVAPVKIGSSVNGADLNGAFKADFTYNSASTPSLTVGEAYQFRGVLNKVATTGGNAPRRIEGLNKDVTPDNDKKVYALDLSGDGNIVTGVNDVKNVQGRELEGIYNLQGQRVSKMEDGSFYILRYTDGTARKILK